MFDVFDIDGDGTLTPVEIQTMLSADEASEISGREKIRKMLSADENIETSDRDRSAANLVSQIDSNGDGRIDFKEFMCMMSGARLEDGAANGQ